VGALGVVAGNVLREHALQVPLVEDEYAVETLGAERADDSLGDGVRARGANRG
jgi:hypothetical protein